MNELIRARAEAMWAEDRASVGLGMKLEEVSTGRARLSMTVTNAMANGHGICHGGFIFSLADSTMAFAANRDGGSAVSQHASISFMHPAHVGDALVAEAMERAHSGRTGIYDVRVSTAGGELVAEFRGHTRTVRPLPASTAREGRAD
jgi:acyl-CoA thioesterase